MKLTPPRRSILPESLMPHGTTIGFSIEISDQKRSSLIRSTQVGVIALPAPVRFDWDHPCFAKNTTMRVTLFGSYPTYSYTMTGRFSVRSL